MPGLDRDLYFSVTMESQESQASAEVKIEIDVAEDVSLYWGTLSTTAGTVTVHSVL